jgi:hypothetical protein
MDSETRSGDAQEARRAAQGRTARKRPFVLNMVTALLVLKAVGHALVAAVLLLGYLDSPPSYLPGIFGERTGFSLYIATMILYGALYVAVAIGLWRLRRWAWVATMLVLGFDLATTIVNYFQGRANYPNMLLSVVCVFYLNDRDVQGLFERRRARETAG